MKIRSGFVSNSSTTSFLIIAAKDDYAKALQSLSDEEHDVVYNKSDTKRIGKQDVVILTAETNGDGYFLGGCQLGSYKDNVDDIFNGIIKGITTYLKNNKCNFYYETDHR